MSQSSATKTAVKPGHSSALAMVQTPIQQWNNIYEPAEALKAGTVFAELDKPFFKGDEKHG